MVRYSEISYLCLQRLVAGDAGSRECGSGLVGDLPTLGVHAGATTGTLPTQRGEALESGMASGLEVAVIRYPIAQTMNK